MLTVGKINKMIKGDFVSAFGDVAEHSPWVAEAAFELKPFLNRGALIKAFRQAADNTKHEMRLALLNAHPDLAGRAALAGELALDSKNEQAGAGLNELTQNEFDRFHELNNRYKERFGFPFIFAVKGANKHQILEAFESRIENDEDTEFETAMQQVFRIFRFRLEDRVIDE